MTISRVGYSLVSCSRSRGRHGDVARPVLGDPCVDPLPPGVAPLDLGLVVGRTGHGFIRHRGPAARRPARPRPPPAGGPAGRPSRAVVESGVAEPVGRCGGLLARTWPPHAVQQEGHAARILEDDMGGDLLIRAYFPQAVQHVGRGARVVEDGVDGSPVRGAGICV